MQVYRGMNKGIVRGKWKRLGKIGIDLPTHAAVLQVTEIPHFLDWVFCAVAVEYVQPSFSAHFLHFKCKWVSRCQIEIECKNEKKKNWSYCWGSRKLGFSIKKRVAADCWSTNNWDSVCECKDELLIFCILAARENEMKLYFLFQQRLMLYNATLFPLSVWKKREFVLPHFLVFCRLCRLCSIYANLSN